MSNPDLLPPIFPFPWACDWGEDRFGPWVAFRVKGVRQALRWVPPATFWMGAPDEESEGNRWGDETRHEVTLTRGLWLADTVCTQALWQAVMGESPSRFKGPGRPVEQVSWDHCQVFLERLNTLVPGLEARLPTEAEWEHGCRAGTGTPFWFGETITTDQVNYDGNYPYGKAPKGEYREQTVAVEALPCNAWGLYQMHGNVWEWCSDWYADYPAGPQTDPVGPATGVLRVCRGGSWFYLAVNCRSARRDHWEPSLRDDYLGLRLARGPVPSPEGQGPEAKEGSRAGRDAGQTEQSGVGQALRAVRRGWRSSPDLDRALPISSSTVSSFTAQLLEAHRGKSLQPLVLWIYLDPYRLEWGHPEDGLGVIGAINNRGRRKVAHELDIS